MNQRQKSDQACWMVEKQVNLDEFIKNAFVIINMNYLSRTIKQMQHLLGFGKRPESKMAIQGQVTENAWIYAALVSNGPTIYEQGQPQYSRAADDIL